MADPEDSQDDLATLKPVVVKIIKKQILQYELDADKHVPLSPKDAQVLQHFVAILGKLQEYERQSLKEKQQELKGKSDEELARLAWPTKAED